MRPPHLPSMYTVVTIYVLQTGEEGAEYHAKVFHHCTEVMKLVQVYCIIKDNQDKPSTIFIVKFNCTNFTSSLISRNGQMSSA